MFNWVAIFNFHSHADIHVFAIDSPSVWVTDTEALMIVNGGRVIHCDQGERLPLVYVSFLEVAPWNRVGSQNRQRLRGLGTAMLRAACDLAMQLGFDGRIGLHSLPASEGFYRRLGFLGLDCPNEYNEMYFELSEAGVEALMRD